ncbi:MAG: hypothetical protein M0P92_06715 [Acholeplasmataceae bacterium]|nr:hypothetical protein [Acholeplasmataceae bacterium]
MLRNTKLSKLSVEDLKAENEEVYNSILELGQKTRDTEVQDLKNENQKLKDEAKIRQTAHKLGIFDKADEVIGKKLSLADSLSLLVDESLKASADSNELSGTFEKTAPPAAGAGSEDSDVSVKTQEQAYDYVKKTYDLKNKKEIIRRARREFPNIFMSTFSRGEKN